MRNVNFYNDKIVERVRSIIIQTNIYMYLRNCRRKTIFNKTLKEKYKFKTKK